MKNTKLINKSNAMKREAARINGDDIETSKKRERRNNSFNAENKKSYAKHSSGKKVFNSCSYDLDDYTDEELKIMGL